MWFCPGRGVHYGKKYLEKFIKNNPKEIKYVLKFDIHHFYESINTDLLKERFASIIKDEIMLRLIYFVIDSNIGVMPDGTIIKKGLPIDYMGFKFYRDKTTIRKSIFLRSCRVALRLHKKLKITWFDACQIISYMGWYNSTDTYEAYKKHIEPFISVDLCKAIMSNHDRRKNGNKLEKGSKQSKTDRN